MAIEVPPLAVTGEIITAAWGNNVRNSITEIDPAGNFARVGDEPTVDSGETGFVFARPAWHNPSLSRATVAYLMPAGPNASTNGDDIPLGFVAELSGAGFVADATVFITRTLDADTGGQAGIASYIAADIDQDVYFFARQSAPRPHANLTHWIIGLAIGGGGATPQGAYFRRTSTGNVFAVTDDSCSTETTDLGALNDQNRRDWEVRVGSDGMSFEFRIDGSLVATHSTTVPDVSLGARSQIVSSGAIDNALLITMMMQMGPTW